MEENFSFHIDPEFLRYFQGRLKQVFLYITDRCNLLCKQCLYKPNVVFQVGDVEIELNTALALVADFRKMGATKISILGGEPSLYGAAEGNIPLARVIRACKELGYRYIRMDTNGIFAPSFLRTPGLSDLDEISFSLDGCTPETNDVLRGAGNFGKTVDSIKQAVELGFRVTVTTCVHRKLAEVEPGSGKYVLDSMIRFVESLGVEEINFHVLMKHGFPMDTWTGDTDIPWSTWVKVCESIDMQIRQGAYGIPVRLPKHFVTQEEFARNPEYYGYCPVKLGERVLVHPDGMIRICSGLISTKYGVARYYARKIVWEEGPLNETRDHDLTALTPCTNQNKGMVCGGMAPLCFSFKPEQTEIVWHEELGWEKKRT